MGVLDIKVIRDKCSDSAIRGSAHSTVRMLQRGIARENVINCISSGEIIEQYPEYWLNPACLIFGLDANGKILHVVVGVDEFVHVVTAYRPDSTTFMPDMKTRREK